MNFIGMILSVQKPNLISRPMIWQYPLNMKVIRDVNVQAVLNHSLDGAVGTTQMSIKTFKVRQCIEKDVLVFTCKLILYKPLSSRVQAVVPPHPSVRTEGFLTQRASPSGHRIL